METIIYTCDRCTREINDIDYHFELIDKEKKETYKLRIRNKLTIYKKVFQCSTEEDSFSNVTGHVCLQCIKDLINRSN